MALKTLPFDASKYLESESAQARFLDDALASGPAGYIAHALGIIARARGMSQLAAETGISRAALYASLSQDGNPSLDTLLRVTRVLGIKLSATFGGSAGPPLEEPVPKAAPSRRPVPPDSGASSTAKAPLRRPAKRPSAAVRSGVRRRTRAPAPAG